MDAEEKKICAGCLQCAGKGRMRGLLMYGLVVLKIHEVDEIIKNFDGGQSELVSFWPGVIEICILL